MNVNSVFYNELMMDMTNLGDCNADMKFLEYIEAAATSIG